MPCARAPCVRGQSCSVWGGGGSYGEGCAGSGGERSWGRGAGCAPGLGESIHACRLTGSSREPPLKTKRWRLRATPQPTSSWPEAPLPTCSFLWGAVVPGRVSQRGSWGPGPGCARSVGHPSLGDTLAGAPAPRKAAVPHVPRDLTVLGLSGVLHTTASVWTGGSGAVCGQAPCSTLFSCC